MLISNGKRYDIFARDSFTCQYCGRRPPEVVLEADHLDPRANGGTDEDVNLITSCFDCNHGKSAKLPSAKAPRPDADLRYLQTQQEIGDLRRYLESKAERDALYKQVIGVLIQLWTEVFKTDMVPAEQQWMNWFSYFSPDEIEKAIRITAGKSIPDNYRRIKYVSGVLHRRREGQNA